MLLTLTGFLRCRGVKRNPVGLIVRNLHKRGKIPVTWEKPQTGWTKLNFDGSYKERTGRASIGGVLRDHNAEFLLGYAESIRPSSSTIAELAALRRGLELILENGWSDVWLEGDAKALVDVIVKKRSMRSVEAQRYITLINEIIPELSNFKMTHIYREGNRAADRLAQMGYHLKKPRVWRNVSPNEVLNIVHEDEKGKIIFRRR